MAENLKNLYDFYCANPERLDQDALSDVQIHEADLRNDMSTHSETYLKWARLSVIANSQHNSLQYHVEKIIWREARLNARSIIASRNEKITDSYVDEIAASDPAYRQHVVLMQRAEAIAETFKRIEFAFLHRRDMIQGLGMRENTERRMLPYGDPDTASARANNFKELESQVRDLIKSSRKGD